MSISKLGSTLSNYLELTIDSSLSMYIYIYISHADSILSPLSNCVLNFESKYSSKWSPSNLFRTKS